MIANIVDLAGAKAPKERGISEMQAWFQNADGTDLAGAFYAYGRRVTPER
jgi:hypothetical protein